MARVPLGARPKGLNDALEALSDQALEAALASGLDLIAVELIKIRASQLNGCAACLQVHVRRALEAGESPERIGLISVWRDTDYFTDVERDVLALAEAATDVEHLEDEEYAAITAHLTRDQVGAALWVAVVINSFNRLGVLAPRAVRPD